MYVNISFILRSCDLNFDINSYLRFFLSNECRLYLDNFISKERKFVFLFEVDDDEFNIIE